MNNKKNRGLINLIAGDWWGLNKTMVKSLGLETALWITDLFSKFEYFYERGDIDEDGFFFNTQEKIKEDTTLSFDKQTAIIKNLVLKGILEVKKKGLPARNFYKINIEFLSEFNGDWLEKNKKLVPVNDKNQSQCFTGTRDSNDLELYNKNKGNNNKLIISSKEDNTLSDDNGTTLVDNSSDRPILKRRKIPLSEKPKRIPLGIQQILTVWNTSGLRKHENPETKVYQECISKIQQLMKGKFFYENPVANGYQEKQFTRDEIIQAIENFKLAALNLDYEPVGSYKEHLKKISFTEFLYNPFSQNGERSLFIKYFETPPKLCSQTVRLPEDKYPVFSKAAMKIYSEKQKKGIGSFTLSDQAKFIKGGEKAYHFYKRNEGKIDQLFIRTDYDKVLLVMEALESQFPQGFEPGNFCSDYTFNEVLPKYLEKQAVLLDDDIFI